MAITVPNSVKFTGSNVTTVTSGSITTVTGSTLVASSTADSGLTVNSPTDNKNGGDFGAAKANPTTGAIQLAAFVRENATGGSGHTCTITYSSATYPSATFSEARDAAAASYDSGSLASGTSGAGSPFARNSAGQAQAANAIFTFCGVDAGGTLTYSNSGYTVVQESDGNNFWTGAVGYQIVNQTTPVTSSWAVSPGASNGCTITFAIKESSAPSTFDVTETSAGTETQERTLAAGVDRAESSAGTTAQDRSIPLATDRAETSAGTEAEDRTVALTRAGTESSAGTDAEDRTLAVSAAAAESSAGTTAQERTAAFSTSASESSAGTTSQDFSAGSQNDAAESSAGTAAQDRSMAVNAAETESAAGTTAQDRTVAATGSVSESSAGTTAQDFTAGATFGTAESSAPSTAQDRTVDAGTWSVNESSGSSTAQTTDVPPVSTGQAALRRWLIQQYMQDEEARKKAKETPAEPAPQRKRPVLRLKKTTEPDYEARLDKAISLAQSLMVDQGADSVKAYGIIAQTTATKALVVKARQVLADASFAETHPTWRKLGQAEWDEDDLLLLAHVL